jgi:cell division septal protein FtsQ
MTDKKMLIGSLSNDLYRIAGLIQRGSTKAAIRFWKESQQWSKELSEHNLKDYISSIIDDLNNTNKLELSESEAEKMLMYSVLLQNYALHSK